MPNFSKVVLVLNINSEKNKHTELKMKKRVVADIIMLYDNWPSGIFFKFIFKLLKSLKKSLKAKYIAIPTSSAEMIWEIIKYVFLGLLVPWTIVSYSKYSKPSLIEI